MQNQNRELNKKMKDLLLIMIIHLNNTKGRLLLLERTLYQDSYLLIKKYTNVSTLNKDLQMLLL